MRILVLGGSVFLSRAVAEHAVRRGHMVVCACRGASGPVPTGAEHVVWDRTGPVPDALARRRFDVVVDVARQPSWVRAGVAAYADAHWVLVSSISVYADESSPGGRPGHLPLHPALDEDRDLTAEPEAYGPMKVACEELVRAGAASCTIVRPGLVVGPGDPTGRFSYWPRRLAEGGEVLAPGDPRDGVQVIDVRDLAAWLVACGEARTTGDHDAVGPVTAFEDLLSETAAGSGGSAGVRLTWVDQGFLTEHGVQPWAGDDAVPLWLPRPAYDGMLAHDDRPARAAGLAPRPVAETARDTLAWLRSDPAATVTGIDPGRERELLVAWADRDAVTRGAGGAG